MQLRTVMQDESGKTLVIALLIVALATLLIGSFLYYVSTSQRVAGAAREELQTHYAADAGIEHALWRLVYEPGFAQTVQTAGPIMDSLTLNGQTAVITITRITPGP